MTEFPKSLLVAYTRFKGVTPTPVEKLHNNPDTWPEHDAIFVGRYAIASFLTAPVMRNRLYLANLKSEFDAGFLGTFVGKPVYTDAFMNVGPAVQRITALQWRRYIPAVAPFADA